ncbi:MAG: MBL fold metallo-hydrolase [Puniceicoccales bacterium]|jgi:phosphoribosyl 1,2-cyclic phosphodiesterase|nr:MBL fold metallo-hydrolase [Puniceicoccales bacterium]
MSFRFHILGTSSEGNCSLLVTPRARILIDAGFTCRRIAERLDSIGERIEDIDAVFLTHEHGDHCKGLAGMARLERPVFHANAETARAIEQANARRAPAGGAGFRWKIFQTGDCFEFAGITVNAFTIPHDAADPVGYTFTFDTGDGRSETIAWVTDLGHVPMLVRARIRNAGVLVLEANYDPALLNASSRPPSLKQRIRGRHGHLSNDATAELLMTLENDVLRRVFLAHLSRECNTPEHVELALAMPRALRPNCVFTVVAPDAPAPVSL